MDKSAWIKLGVALGLLGASGWFLFRYLSSNQGVSEKAFFYDLSNKKLFAGPRTAVPPIRGVDGPEEDAVRAVVISTNAQPERKSTWRIAYLEMYSPELKRQMEAAQRTGGSPAMGRSLAQHHRFVRRLADAQWFSLSSPEGEKIVSEWAVPSPQGLTPAVCTP